MKSFSIIVAIADNYAIGKENRLLWHIPEDLKRFKRITTGHTLIMGKNTFESLPVRPLPNRTSIVLSDIPGDRIEGCIMAYSLEEAIEKCPEDECFVIGGGMVYRQFLPIADKLYITWVHRVFDADTFFPEMNMDDWELIESKKHGPGEKNDFSYTYSVYKRKN